MRKIFGVFAVGMLAVAVGCVPLNGDGNGGNGGDGGNEGNGGNATPFSADLSGDAERPVPVVTDATGTGTFTLSADETQLTYNVSAAGLSGDVTAAHFHLSDNGAEGSGAPVFTITDAIVNDGNGGTTAQGTWNISAADVSNLQLGDIYVNFHTDANPGGEVRGNLTADS
ncbi:MAG: CHRD domain-containing protein [Planctomycetes bacterium]|nr:CHRD domain-containing protein [Planctomycetota bacterium]